MTGALDPDDVAEALESAATAHMRYDGCPKRRNHIAHGPRAVRTFRHALARFLAELPADATIEELRDALAANDVAQDEGEG